MPKEKEPIEQTVTLYGGFISVSAAVRLIGGDYRETRERINDIIENQGITAVPQMQDHKRKGLHIFIPFSAIDALIPPARNFILVESSRDTSTGGRLPNSGDIFNSR